MNPMPQNVQEIKDYFNFSLAHYYDREEIKNLCLLTLEKYLNISRAALRIKSDMQIQEDVARKFVLVVEELLEHKPIQYILGETEFYGLKFLVDEEVLIPRQETEELVDWILRDLHVRDKNEALLKGTQHKPLKLMDIGTGSGCIPITLKKNRTELNVYALDVSEGALQLASKNAALNEVEIHFMKQNILQWKNEINADLSLLQFDIIVSNPPYVLQTEKNNIQKNVLDYEPHLALFVEDENPLLFYETIATFAQKHLSESGYLYFEINEQFGDAMVQMLGANGFEKVELKKDLNGKDRMVKARKIKV